jgi:predicted transcriptional regulator
MLVRDLMTVGVVTCSEETPVADIARMILDKGLEAIVVLDEAGHALGTVSQFELVKIYNHPDPRKLKAEAIMREGVPQVPPDLPVTTAAQIMQDQGTRALFLMHHAGGIEYPAAVLSYYHLLRYLAADSDEELHDLGIAAARQAPLEAFVNRRDAARRRQTKREYP